MTRYYKPLIRHISSQLNASRAVLPPESPLAILFGIGRMVRRGPVGPVPAGPAMGHPMIGLLSGLFARQRSEAAPPTHDREGTKSR